MTITGDESAQFAKPIKVKITLKTMKLDLNLYPDLCLNLRREGDEGKD